MGSGLEINASVKALGHLCASSVEIKQHRSTSPAGWMRMDVKQSNLRIFLRDCDSDSATGVLASAKLRFV